MATPDAILAALQAALAAGKRAVCVTIWFTDGTCAQVGLAESPPATDALTGFKSQVFNALTSEWAKAETVARRCDHECDSYLRRMLQELVEEGRAQRSRGSYRLANAN